MAKSSTGKPMIEGRRAPLGYQRITSVSSVVTLTPPQGTQQVLIQAETQDVRWRDDGTDPSSTVGVLLPKNTLFVYEGDFSKIRFIEVTASSKLNISYYI